MFVPKAQWILAGLLGLCYCNVLAGQVNRRAEDPVSVSITSGSSSTASVTESPDTSASAAASTNGPDTSPDAEPTPTATLPAVVAATSDIVGAMPTAKDGQRSTFDSAKTPNKLPLTPEVTPGFGVAGTILLLTGLAYATVGIKRNALQVYISAAYLASVATTVLIIYVMHLPVSNGVQGAYVVAVVLTGVVIGAAAMFFKDITQGVGCLLGGFSFSMWLLTLARGGLIKSVSGKAILISILSLLGFALSFNRITRPYGLIASTAFGGATAIVLGIDCFSRAGLKEFWAWIWDVNDDLFPLGATTYPLTKGIKVETAAIVVLFVAGVMSQVKLWKLVKERRERKAKQLEHFEHETRQQEAAIGRRIEFKAAQERVRWERVYAEKDGMTVREDSLRDSGFGDGDSQKRSAVSTATSIRQVGEGPFEMVVVTPTSPNSPVLSPIQTAASEDERPTLGAKTTASARSSRTAASPRSSHVFVASEPASVPLAQPTNGARSTNRMPSGAGSATWVVGTDGEARPERNSTRNSLNRSLRISTRNSGTSIAEGPKSPIPDIAVEEESPSITATTPADEEPRSPIDSKRLSVSSAHMLRRISTRSKRSFRNFQRLPDENDDPDDRASSVAATVDEEDRDQLPSRRTSWASVASGKPASGDCAEAPGIQREGEDRVDGSAESRPALLDEELCEVDITESHLIDERAKESAPAVVSTPPPPPTSNPLPPSTSLTSTSLPPRLPKIAVNFRTNEWAKHIPTDIEPPQQSPLLPTTGDHGAETVAPVDVVALQEQATDAPAVATQVASPPPTIVSSSPDQRERQTQARAASHHSNTARTLSQVSQQQPSLISRNSAYSARSSVRPASTSQEAILAARPAGLRSSSAPYYNASLSSQTQLAPSRMSVARSPTPGTGRPTLLEQRDSMIRQKTASLQLVPSTNGSNTNLERLGQPRHMVRSASATSLHAHGWHPQTQSPVAQSVIAEEELDKDDDDDDEADNISLSARRDMLRRSQLHAPSVPTDLTPLARPALHAQQTLTGMSGNGTGLHGQGIMTGGRRVSGLGPGADAASRPEQQVMDRKLAHFRASVQEDRRREEERRWWGGGVGGGESARARSSMSGFGMPGASGHGPMMANMNMIPGPVFPSQGTMGVSGVQGLDGNVGTINADRHREAMRRLQAKAGG